MRYRGEIWLKNLTKGLNYVGNDVDLWEMAKICGKWLKYLTKGLDMWEMTFAKWLKYLGNGLDILGTA